MLGGPSLDEAYRRPIETLARERGSAVCVRRPPAPNSRRGWRVVKVATFRDTRKVAVMGTGGAELPGERFQHGSDVGWGGHGDDVR